MVSSIGECSRYTGRIRARITRYWSNRLDSYSTIYNDLTTLFQIKNDRDECHRLKKDESFPLLGDLSFAPSVDRYGKPTGPNDYLYSFRFYTEHEVEECLGPDELLKRKKARARFKTARL